MDTIDDLLVRYLGDTATPEEREVIERWLRDPANAMSFERMRVAWEKWGRLRQESHGRSDVYETAHEWRRLVARMRSPEPVPFPRRRRVFSRHWLARAAAIAALVAGVAFWPTLRDTLGPAPGFQAHATAPGQRGRITLADGSTVLLGPASELRIPKGARRGIREVELVGTAFFDIARSVRQPFVVSASGTVTRVLGTKFLVRAYASEEVVAVAVAEGRVAVHASSDNEADAVVLAGGGGVRVGRDGKAERVDEADVAALLALTEGRLVFRDAPVEAVLRELERWYDVQIHVADPELVRSKLSLFLEQRSFERALPLIAIALNARYEWDGREVTLYRAEPSER